MCVEIGTMCPSENNNENMNDRHGVRHDNGIRRDFPYTRYRSNRDEVHASNFQADGGHSTFRPAKGAMNAKTKNTMANKLVENRPKLTTYSRVKLIGTLQWTSTGG